jgi:hypothetical protein
MMQGNTQDRDNHMLQHTEQTRTQQVQVLPDERLVIDGRDVVVSMGATLLLGLAALVGFLVAGYAWPSHGAWSIWRIGLVGFGGFVLLTAGTIGLLVPRYLAAQWRDDRAYRQDRRAATLDAYEHNQGVTTSETVSETTITADDPLKMLLLALAIDQRIGSRECPYSVRNLCGPQFLRVNRRLCGTAQLRIGEITTKEEAQEIAMRFARMGLIDGRRPNVAGDWTPTGANDVVQRFLEG